MDVGKFGGQPPLMAAFCLCALFIFMHFASAPSEPHGFGAEETHNLGGAPTHNFERTPSASFMALRNGVAVKHGGILSNKVGKQEVKQEQHLMQQLWHDQRKELSHVKQEEKHLKKEKKLLEEEKAAFQRGQDDGWRKPAFLEHFHKLEKKLSKLAKAEARDASIADKVAKDEHKKEGQLHSLFAKWSARMGGHASNQWSSKHQKDMKKEGKTERRLGTLALRQSKVEKGQAMFLEQRRAFEQGKPPV